MKKVLLFSLGAVLLLAPGANSYFSSTATNQNNTLSASSNFGSTPTPAPQTNHIVISEVQIDGGTGQANDNDFIELYNPTNNPISLSGHRLVKRTGSSPNDTNIFTFTTQSVPARGFFLWANSGFSSTIGADVSSSDTLASNNSIALRNGTVNTGIIVDALSWNSASTSLKEGTEFSPNPGINESMERKAYSTSTTSTMTGSDTDKGNGYDSDKNSADFVLRLTSQPQNSSSPTESP